MISALTSFAAPCGGGGFFGLPSWYMYLDGNGQTPCGPVINGISDVWLIVAAVLEILLRVAALVAIVMIVYSGIQFIMSEGDPEKRVHARQTSVNAIVGLLMAITAAGIVTFVAGRFH